MSTPFVQLRNQSGYSFSESLLQPEQLIDLAKADGMTAIGITDNNNVIGALEFYTDANKKGIKPIIGCDTLIGDKVNADKALFFAQNNTGWKNLSAILTDAARQQEGDDAYANKESLQLHNPDIIAVIGGPNSLLYAAAKAGNVESATAIINEWKVLFGDRLYIELQRVGRPEEAQVIQMMVDLSAQLNVPVVATHPTCFKERSDFYAHEVRTCITTGVTLHDGKRPHNYTPEQYWQTQDQMAELFADIPEALENANQLAMRCNLKLTLGKSVFPPYPGTISEQIAELEAKSKAGLVKNLAPFPEKLVKIKEYEDRLDYELKMIQKTGFVTYFLVVAEFIQWAKNQDIPVGPGRGSGAGSVVAYSLGVTETDPVEHELMFERFINPDRVSLPDFDVDFCIERRSEVIDHCRERYGANSVAGIGAVGTLGAKAAIKGAVRALALPYTLGESISKLIPKYPLDISLEKSIEEVAELREKISTNPRVAEMMHLAQAIENLPSQTGQHAAGVVIAAGPVENFGPLFKGNNGLLTQFNKDDVETAGLVKFDFLGLKTLTVLDKTVKLINAEKTKKKEALVNLHTLRENDPAVFAMLAAGNTNSVFQIEGDKITKLAQRAHISNFAELTDLLALYRPGPIKAKLIDLYVDRKAGVTPVEYVHPILEPLLNKTQGILVYQEQIMSLAQKLAGYTLGQADLLRRAMGKKKPEEMEKQRNVFIAGAFKTVGMNAEQATDLFNMIEKFAEYGFNKSHSAAYAQISYRTAWCKKYYGPYYLACHMDSLGKSEDIMPCVQDAKKNGINVLPPDINKSGFVFQVEDNNGTPALRYSLSSLNKVGSASRKIVIEREKNGPYTSLTNFCQRLGEGGGALRKDVLESLIRAGSFDQLEPNRAQLMEYVEPLLAAIRKKTTKASKLGNPLGELFQNTTVPVELKIDVTPVPMWTEKETAQFEKLAVGFHLQSNPYQIYAKHLRTVSKWVEIPVWEQSPAIGDGVGAGIVESIKVWPSKKGDMAGVFVNDGNGTTTRLTLFAEQWKEMKPLLKEGELFIFKGYKKTDTRGTSLIVNEGYTWETCDPLFSNELRVSAENTNVNHILNFIKSQKGWDIDRPAGRRDTNKRLVVYHKKDSSWRALAFSHGVNLNDAQIQELGKLTQHPVFVGKPPVITSSANVATEILQNDATEKPVEDVKPHVKKPHQETMFASSNDKESSTGKPPKKSP